jgi:hypothetical protein
MLVYHGLSSCERVVSTMWIEVAVCLSVVLAGAPRTLLNDP